MVPTMTEPTVRSPVLLLVDDEPSILAALRRLLRAEGYVLHTAESGAAGLELLAQQPVDLVVSDMRMPGMSGVQFLEQVRQRWPHTMRLLLTGYADVTATIDAINRGEIYRYLNKPWDDGELRSVIRDALHVQRLRSENERLLELTKAQNEELLDLNEGLETKVAQRTQELEQVNSFLNLANDRLKQRFMIMVKMFSSLLELRGGAMAGHSRRVAELARKVAATMNEDSRVQQDVFLAGLLHDIGKIGMPDALLSKPVSRMVGHDMVEYAKHSANGEAALLPLEELRDVAHIVRSHHERFDGHGFPDSLQGTDIPIGARILSVANDFDSLQIGTLSDKRMSADEAKGMILQGKGKAYDPQVVDALLRWLDQDKAKGPPSRQVAVAELEPGMVLAHDLIGPNGVLLLAAGRKLDAVLVRHMKEYAGRQNLKLNLQIRSDPVPPPA